MAENKKILTLDLQTIVNKLHQISTLQISKDTMISDEADANTKEFLSFLVKLFETAKELESISTDNNIEKLNRLIKDSDEVLSKFFTNNNLIDYYEETLSSKLKTILESSENAGNNIDVDKIKENVISILKSLNASIDEKRQVKFKEAAEKFKEEFTTVFKEEIILKAKDIVQNVEKEIEEITEKAKPQIAKEITESVNSLLYKNVPLYLKSLNGVFDENFKRYIEANFTNKARQSAVSHKIRQTFGSVISPFVFVYKQIKYTKENAKIAAQVAGVKAKRKWYERFTDPFKNFRKNVGKRFEGIRKGFLQHTRFIRRPGRLLRLKYGKFKRDLDKNETMKVLKKYGPLGLLAKAILNAYRKKYKNAALVGQMDFKPFKYLSTITNTVDEFIDSVEKHTKIIANNLRIFFDQNNVEKYNVRNKLGFFKSKRKNAKEEEQVEDGGFGLLDFLMSLPLLLNKLKRFWKTIKGAWKFVKNVGKFLKRLSLNIFAHGAKLIGRILMWLSPKSSRLWQIGKKLSDWGDETIHALKTSKRVEQVAKRIDDISDVVHDAKSLDKLDDAAKTIKGLDAELDALRAEEKALREAGQTAKADKLLETISKLEKRIERLKQAVKAKFFKLGGKADDATDALKFIVSHGDEVVDAAKGANRFFRFMDDIADWTRRGAEFLKNTKVVSQIGRILTKIVTNPAGKIVLKTGKIGLKILTFPGVDFLIDAGCGWLEAKFDPDVVKIFRPNEPGAELTDSELESYIWANTLAGADTLNPEGWSSFGSACGTVFDTAGTILKYAAVGGIAGPWGALAGGVVGLVMSCIGTPRLARWIEGSPEQNVSSSRAQTAVPRNHTGLEVIKEQAPPYIRSSTDYGPASQNFAFSDYGTSSALVPQQFPDLQIPQIDQELAITQMFGLGGNNFGEENNGSSPIQSASEALQASMGITGLNNASEGALNGETSNGGTASGGSSTGANTQTTNVPNYNQTFYANPFYRRPQEIQRFYDDIAEIVALRKVKEEFGVSEKPYSYTDMAVAEQYLHQIEMLLGSPDLIERKITETNERLLVELTMLRHRDSDSELSGDAQNDLNNVEKLTFCLEKLLDDAMVETYIIPTEHSHQNHVYRATAAADYWSSYPQTFENSPFLDLLRTEATP